MKAGVRRNEKKRTVCLY